MKTILFAGGPWAGLTVSASTIAHIPKDPDGSGTGFLLRLLGRDGALYTYHLKGNVASLVSTIHSEASLEMEPPQMFRTDLRSEAEKRESVLDRYELAKGLGDGVAQRNLDRAIVDLLLSDPRTFRLKEDTP